MTHEILCEVYEVGWDFVTAPEQQQGLQQQPHQNLAAILYLLIYPFSVLSFLLYYIYSFISFLYFPSCYMISTHLSLFCIFSLSFQLYNYINSHPTNIVFHPSYTLFNQLTLPTNSGG